MSENPQKATPAVEVDQLTKVFALGRKKQYVVAVEDLSLTIGAGEVYGLIGPNGSGKSTTMKVVLGLMAPSRGSTRIFGVDSREVKSRNDIGFLPENPYFYKHLTGAETLKFFGKLCSLRGKELKNRVDEMLELVDLQDARNRRLGGYSKGMLQRIGLAQAMIQRPRLVILDEPTAGVDPVGSRKIRDLIFRLKDDGVSVFLCSHLLEQVQEVCDRVGMILAGKMNREGTVDELCQIADKTELILDGASPEILGKIREIAGTTLLEEGHPKRSLEQLFLDMVEQGEVDASAVEEGDLRTAGNAKTSKD